MALEFNFSMEESQDLFKLGFRLSQDTRGVAQLVYESGSISNWTRVILRPAFDEYSLAHDEYVPCVIVECESEQAPGYAETDWYYKSTGKIPTQDLFKWLESKHISLKTIDQRNYEHQVRIHKRKELREKLATIGLKPEDITEVF